MAELDRLREQIAYRYQPYWLAAFWVRRSNAPEHSGFHRCRDAKLRYLGFAPGNRTAHKADRDAVMIETLATIAMVIFVLVILGVGLDAARRK